MSIDKALYQAPQGLAAIDGPDVEIEIVDPEEVDIKMDGVEVQLGGESIEDFDANLAEYVPESVLTQIAGDLMGDFQSDIDSRKDWIQTYVDGLELLGLKIEERSEPWAVSYTHLTLPTILRV